MLVTKEKAQENSVKISLNENDESLIHKILSKKLCSCNMHAQLSKRQISSLNFIVNSSKCNSFERMIKRLYFSNEGFQIEDKYYKELLFRTATKQHLEIMRIESLLFRLISNINVNTENFFKNFEEIFLLKKDDKLERIIKCVKADKPFLQSVKELDKQLAFMDYEKKAKIYNYLKKEFYFNIDETATEAVALIFSEYPLMPILINAWNYADSIATNAFRIDLPDIYKQFLSYYTTKGDFIDTYHNIMKTTIKPNQIKNSLCFMAGTSNFKNLIRKYFILNYQSERKDNQLLDFYNDCCSKIYKDLIKGRKLAYYDFTVFRKESAFIHVLR